MESRTRVLLHSFFLFDRGFVFEGHEYGSMLIFARRNICPVHDESLDVERSKHKEWFDIEADSSFWYFGFQRFVWI